MAAAVIAAPFIRASARIIGIIHACAASGQGVQRGIGVPAIAPIPIIGAAIAVRTGIAVICHNKSLLLRGSSLASYYERSTHSDNGRIYKEKTAFFLEESNKEKSFKSKLLMQSVRIRSVNYEYDIAEKKDPLFRNSARKSGIELRGSSCESALPT